MPPTFSYTRLPDQIRKGPKREIAVFENNNGKANVDSRVVKAFGEEWSKFASFDDADIEQIGNQYFDIVTSAMLGPESNVIDIGCGTGRWSKYLLKKGVKFIEAVDPSVAIFSADHLLAEYENVRLTQATTDNLPFADNSFDFGMSIGVLHHIPDTSKAMADCIQKIKPGGYFYTYLYYKVNHRGAIFTFLLSIVTAMRFIISRLPGTVKKFVCDLLALFIYMPFIVVGRGFKTLGLDRMAKRIPLHDYQDKSFFIIRNDALDRFGTILEQRFSKEEVIAMMAACGLKNIVVSEREPWWHAVGQKKPG
jgi:ubiquinone/menaquinone biosynthesis C-methylase UbiE